MPSKTTLKRKPGETRSEYVSRLMGNKTMQKEYPEQKQRAAVAYFYWKQTTNKSKSKSKKSKR